MRAAGPPQGDRPLGGAARSAVRGEHTSRGFRPPLTACACALVVATCGLAHAQVYKCVDRAGRTTYQQQPCPDAQKGGRMALSVDNGSTRQDGAAAADLEAKAAGKKILPGMTRALVVKAHGTPQEMRTGEAGENATEVWVYRKRDLNARVGFRGGFVAWVNDTPAAAAETGAPVAADAPPRQTLARGMPCGSLQRQIGNAAALEEDYDPALARKVLRMTWPPTDEDPERLVVTCDGGVIARVDRSSPPVQ